MIRSLTINNPGYLASLLTLDVSTNVFLALSDSLWTNPANWSRGHVPDSTETATIRANCTFNTVTTVDKLVIESGKSLTFDSTDRVLTVNNDFDLQGTLDLSSAAHIIELKGTSNTFAGTFTAGTSSTVRYAREGDQTIPVLSYRNLSVTGSTGTKTQAGTLSLAGNLIINGPNFDPANYNLTVNGTTSVTHSGATNAFRKTGAGTMTFVGLFTCSPGTIDWRIGNPSVEFRGGISMNTFSCYTGTGTVTFNGNQTFTLASYLAGQWNAPVLIKSGTTFTLAGSTDNLPVYSVINGEDGTSTFNNNGKLDLYTSTMPMSVGVFNYNNLAGSSIGFMASAAHIIPYTTFSNLRIGGTGTKTTSGTTTVNNNFTRIGSFDAAHDFTVLGNTTNPNSDSTKFLKSTPGNLLFVGSFSSNIGGVDWRGGNPNVEFRGGLSLTSLAFYTGSGTFTFSTNNQTLTNVVVLEGGAWAANILVSGAITLTMNWSNSTASTNPVSAWIDGNNAASKLDYRGSTLIYQNTQRPMLTGILECNAAVNTFIYGKAGDQDVTGGTYRNLTLAESGNKTLQGNVSVINTYSVTGTAVRVDNGYTFGNP